MTQVRNKTVVTVISKISDRTKRRDACLVMIYGMDLGRKYGLDSSTISIGRSSRSNIQIDQDSVSRQHAKIINNGKAILLRDLGSTNGTYVNDELIDEVALRDGDFVKIGRTIFKFLSGDNIESAYHEEIYRLTTVDGLTQIFNRRYLLEQLDREVSRAKRYRRALSLILFDIDHFKQINDTSGHLAGDYVLKQLATVVQGKIRREDLLARFGGEEFAIVLPEIDAENAVLFGEKVRKIIEKASFKFEDTKLQVTVSVGVSATEENDDASSLVKRTDAKLYEAKVAGRNCVRG